MHIKQNKYKLINYLKGTVKNCFKCLQLIIYVNVKQKEK